MQKTVDREKQEFTKGEKTETSPPKKSRTDELLMRPGGELNYFDMIVYNDIVLDACSNKRVCYQLTAIQHTFQESK